MNEEQMRALTGYYGIFDLSEEALTAEQSVLQQDFVDVITQITQDIANNRGYAPIANTNEEQEVLITQELIDTILPAVRLVIAPVIQAGMEHHIESVNDLRNQPLPNQFTAEELSWADDAAARNVEIERRINSETTDFLSSVISIVKNHFMNARQQPYTPARRAGINPNQQPPAAASQPPRGRRRRPGMQ